MKRILLSITVAFLLVVVYMAIVSIIFARNNYDASLLPYINLPVRLPQIIYYYFLPPTAEDYQMTVSAKKIILGILFFVLNVLLYSIPVYLLLRLILSFRKPKAALTEQPPPPPLFND